MMGRPGGCDGSMNPKAAALQLDDSHTDHSRDIAEAQRLHQTGAVAGLSPLYFSKWVPTSFVKAALASAARQGTVM